MILVYVLLFLVAAIMLYLLFAPFYLEINSNDGFIVFRFQKVFSAGLFVRHEDCYFQFQLAGWRKQIPLEDLIKPGKTKSKRGSGRVKKKENNFSFKKMRALVRSFKVPVCTITLDTGDMQLNGILYPLFWWIGNAGRKEISISFTGRTEIRLVLKNSIARMLWVYLRA